MHVYDLKDGEELVKAARSAIELYLKNPHFNKNLITNNLKKFEEHNGLFVTLEYYQTNELRGCVGFTSSNRAMRENIIDAALAAAFEDYRFLSITFQELNDLIIEVSILSDLEKISGNKEQIKKQIKIGKDGLMIQYGIYSGLLLPIVAVEQKWNIVEFLENVCLKAGLNKNYWSYPNANLYKFETQIFKEQKPDGKVIEVKLTK